MTADDARIAEMASSSSEALRLALHRAAGALGIELFPAQADELTAFVELLQRWNTTYNLTAVRGPAQMVTQHLADCLAVVEPLRKHLDGRPALRLLDVGSGGGLPGVVLAILLPSLDVTCVDSVGKKTAFVRQVAAELRLPNLRAEHQRIERLAAAPFDVIASRAFASLADFVCLTRHVLADGGVWLAMKGKRPDAELSELPAAVVELMRIETLAVPGLDAKRCLVWMRATA